MIDSIGDEKKRNGKNSRSLPERLEELVHNPSVGPFLTPASFVYGAGSYLRLLSFSMGLATRIGAAVPVISIGNVTVGGTGKTPVVIDLADRLSAQGLKVAILSRGYGRRSKAKIVVVSAGAGPIVSVDEAGDEPYMMARAVPSAIVLVGSKRVDLARLAVEKYGAQIILLDDGFQHVQLKRDVDIVLFDYNDDPDLIALLPRGRLREPLTALGRASDIVVTKIPEFKAGSCQSEGDKALVSDAESNFNKSVKMKIGRLRSRLSSLAPSAVLHFARFSPSYLLSEFDDSSNVVKLTAISGKKIFALCGIARPDGFFRSLTELGATIVDKMTFGDHHWYTVEDVAEIDRRFRDSRAAYIVTSEKDRVRLHLPVDLSALTFALMLETVWMDGSGAKVSNPVFVQCVLDLVPAPAASSSL
jgi:tetraacyldisaccharide 4'-kinase